MTARVASPNGNRSIALLVDGTPSNIYAVPNTGSLTSFGSTVPPITCWDPPVGFGSCDPVPVSLAAGTHSLKLVFHGDDQSLDRIEFERAPAPAREPNGTPFRYLDIPGTIQAENYNWGGEGTAFHDTTPGNEGGAYRHDGVDIETAGGVTNVGWIRTGEYLNYTATVTKAGHVHHDRPRREPEQRPDHRRLRRRRRRRRQSRSRTPARSRPSQTVEVPVTLAAGSHTMKLVFSGDGQNLDWIAFAHGPADYDAAADAGAVRDFVAVPHDGAARQRGEVHGDPGERQDHQRGLVVVRRHGPPATPGTRGRSNPTFFYPSAGIFSPLVKLTYTDGSTETVQRTNYVKAT